MRLSKNEKQTLLGPLVIGVLCGAFAALASLAFDSEYGPHLYAGSPYSLTTISITNGVLAFVSVVGGIVLLFGVLPIVLPRIVTRIARSRGRHD